MNLFGFLKRNKQPAAITYRLVWFELQITPFAYRFAIVPNQPILIGLEGVNGEKGCTLLIRYDHIPEVFNKTVERVDALVKQCDILALPLCNPGAAFAEDQMKSPAVHLRLAYADNTRWAGVYSLTQLPDGVATLLKETKGLARQIMKEESHDTISGEEAHEHLKPEKNAAPAKLPSVILKIRVTRLGRIDVNDQKVNLPELNLMLDELKEKQGGVWYYREDPTNEPLETTNEIIKQVLDAVISRQLPIQLQQEKY